jgi:chromosome segregation ATPase
MLNKWLDYCVERGHRFPVTSPLRHQAAIAHSRSRTWPISDRLSNIRQLLPGARQPEQDERLLQLYWNRAELKKELTRLQDERMKLLEQLRNQETATARAKEQVQVLEEYLGNPEIAVHALVYFQLRAVWRAAGARLGRFAGH